MRLRRRLMLMLLALLGAAVVVLPAVAGSETTPTDRRRSTPKTSTKHSTTTGRPPTVAIEAGGVVTFSNPSTRSRTGSNGSAGPATPSCSRRPGGSRRRVGHQLERQLHVHAAGHLHVLLHGPPDGDDRHGHGQRGRRHDHHDRPRPHHAGDGAPTGAPTGSPASDRGPRPARPARRSPGAPSQAVRLARSQRGESVRGSLKVSPAGAGGRLEVDLLATRASLARAGQLAQVRVGRLVRSSLRAGTVAFTVALSAQGQASAARRVAGWR